MIKKVNKTEEIRVKLIQEDKVSYFDKPEHVKAITKMNKEMEELRREYKLKEKNSQSSASNVVLTS